MSLKSVTAALNSVSTAVQTVEVAASQSQATTGTAVSGAQKLEAAVSLISAVSPNAAEVLGPLEAVIAAFVTLFNSFGLFSHASAPAAQQQ